MASWKGWWIRRPLCRACAWRSSVADDSLHRPAVPDRCNDQRMNCVRRRWCQGWGTRCVNCARVRRVGGVHARTPARAVLCWCFHCFCCFCCLLALWALGCPARVTLLCAGPLVWAGPRPRTAPSGHAVPGTAQLVPARGHVWCDATAAAAAAADADDACCCCCWCWCRVAVDDVSLIRV